MEEDNKKIVEDENSDYSVELEKAKQMTRKYQIDIIIGLVILAIIFLSVYLFFRGANTPILDANYMHYTKIEKDLKKYTGSNKKYSKVKKLYELVNTYNKEQWYKYYLIKMFYKNSNKEEKELTLEDLNNFSNKDRFTIIMYDTDNDYAYDKIVIIKENID